MESLENISRTHFLSLSHTFSASLSLTHTHSLSLSHTQVLSSEGLQLGGVYLLENGSDAFVHLDKLVDPRLVQVYMREREHASYIHSDTPSQPDSQSV